jgi:hypothetical protein
MPKNTGQKLGGFAALRETVLLNCGVGLQRQDTPDCTPLKMSP